MQPLRLGKKGFFQIQRQLPVLPSEWLIGSQALPFPAAAEDFLLTKTASGQVLFSIERPA